MTWRALLGLCLLATPCAAQETRHALYDGTTLAVVAGDNTLELRYIVPPAILRELGVEVGTPLVRGRWDGPVFTGDAFMFTKDCPPIAYPVRGMIDLAGAFVVIGPVPTKAVDCRGDAYEWNEQSVMRFESSARPRATITFKPKPKPKPKPSKPKPKPKPRPQQPQQPQLWWQWR
jgi:hypothetical protein